MRRVIMAAVMVVAMIAVPQLFVSQGVVGHHPAIVLAPDGHDSHIATKSEAVSVQYGPAVAKTGSEALGVAASAILPSPEFVAGTFNDALGHTALEETGLSTGTGGDSTILAFDVGARERTSVAAILTV